MVATILGKRMVSFMFMFLVASVVVHQFRAQLQLSVLFPTSSTITFEPPKPAERGTSCNEAPSENDRPPIFDPFVDVPFHELDDGSSERKEDFPYSSFRCVGSGSQIKMYQSEFGLNQTRWPWFVQRTCYYTNLYYNVDSQEFLYVASPSEMNLSQHNKDPNYFTRHLSVSMNHVPSKLGAGKRPLEIPNVMKSLGVIPWKPRVVPSLHYHSTTSRFTTSNMTDHNSDSAFPPHLVATVPENMVFLLFRPYHSMNVGHFFWDDSLSLFQLLDTFGLTKDKYGKYRQPVSLFVEISTEKQGNTPGDVDPQWRCSPANPEKWSKCVATYRKFYPQIWRIATDPCTGDILRTGNWLLSEEIIGTWPGRTKEKCLPAMEQGRTNVLPHGTTKYIRLPKTVAGIGRLGMFACDMECPLKVGPQLVRYRDFLLSNLLGWDRNGCRRPEPKGYITFSLPFGSSRPERTSFFEEEIVYARQNYGDRVRVEEFAKMTLPDQASLVANTAVFFTNHGGGSFVSTFLPDASTVIVYWHGKIRFDHSFYEATPYFTTLWVDRQQRDSLERTFAWLDVAVEKWDRDHELAAGW